MNWDYWDKHKLASVLMMVLVIAFYGLSQMLISLDEVASEKVANSLSYTEAQIILEWYETYESKFSPRYYTLDSLHTLIWLVLPLIAIYVGLSALYIPERYQQQDKTESESQNV